MALDLTRDSARRSGAPASAIAWAIGLALGTVLVLTAALSLNLLPRAVEVREGDVAAVSIRAPRKASYVSQLRTRSARDQATAQVAPIVQLDYDLIDNQRRELTDLLQAIDSARTQPPSGESRTAAIRRLSVPPIDDAAAATLANLAEPRWLSVRAESQRLLADILKDRLSEEEVAEVHDTLPLRVQPGFTEGERGAIVHLVGRFLRSNVSINMEATARARAEAQQAVAPVVQTYERGQTIVRDGQVVGPIELEALEALGLRNPELDWQGVVDAALLSAIVVGILSAYVWQFSREMVYRQRRLVLLAGLVVITVVAAKMVIPGRPLWVYVFPLPAVTMLLATLLDARLAITAGVLLSVLVAWIAGGMFDVATVFIAGTVVGALAVWRRERIQAYFLAGVYVAVVQVTAYLAFFLTSHSDDFISLPIIAFELLVSGVLSALLALGSFAIVGRLFGIMTTMQLLELANPTQPLLRRLLMEAPGTYHHSIMVGNLAERAAEVIGADSLLVRVAAYYHDVGKLERPWAFIENQTDVNSNIHDSIEPLESAQIISSHVPDGVRLAERYRLPRSIVDLIPQHHGTRTVSFFYQKAAERTNEELDISLFSYPGPRPQSREAALLMLADSTEAAARAARDHSQDAIERLVDQIIRQRLDDGQFDDCDLTFRDLTRIRESFVTLLTGIYHGRIPYPAPAPQANPASSAIAGAPANAPR